MVERRNIWKVWVKVAIYLGYIVMISMFPDRNSWVCSRVFANIKFAGKIEELDEGNSLSAHSIVNLH